MTRPRTALVDVRIDAIALDGDGVARTAEGAVFVPGAAPGERVRIRLGAGHARTRRGELVEVLEPAPERVPPRCEVFGRCGGCQLQHLSYDAQLAAKRRALAHALGRDVDAFVPAPSPWGYRVRVRLHATGGAVGQHAAGSRRLVVLERCPVLDPEVEVALGSVGPMVARAVRGEAEILLDRGRDGRPVLLVRPEAPLDRDAHAALEAIVASGEAGGIAIELPGLPGTTRLGDPEPWTTAADGGPMHLAPGSFGQANPRVTEQLGQALVEGLSPEPADRVLELYAGSGTFTLALSPRVTEIVAVESSPAGARALEDNAARRGFGNIRVIRADAAAHATKARGSFALVVLDPPRTGAPEAVLEAVAARRARRVAYISCDARSLGRDLARLHALGLSVRTLVAFDMFPQTSHVEVLAVLGGRAS